MSVIIYPEKLNLGDTVAVTAVSQSANLEKIDLAEESFRKSGLMIIESKNVRNEEVGMVSSSGEERAEELLELYKDSKVKYIIAARGGEFLMEMMPYLDSHREVIKNNPKWFQGFSDPSLLNLYITTNFNIATVNYENISEYAMNPKFPAIQDALEFIFDSGKTIVQNSFEKYQYEEFEEGNLKGYNLTEDNIYKCKENNVKFSGRLIGACLDVINQLSGTKMDNIANFVNQFDEEGVIWYLDNCELSSCEMYRRLWHMKELGYFKNIKGFLFGRSFMQRNDNPYFTFYDAVERALGDLRVPIVYNVDIGHIPPQMMLVNGSLATFEYNEGKGTLTQELI